jgi:hypothetical protein
MAAQVSTPPTGDPEFYDLWEKTTIDAVEDEDIQTGLEIGPLREQDLSPGYSASSDGSAHTYKLEVRATAWKIPARVTTTELLRTFDLVLLTSSDVTTVTTATVQGNDPVDTGTHTLPATDPGVTSYYMSVTHTIQVPLI